MSLPRDFMVRMTSRLGDSAGAFFRSLQENPPVSIRLNPFKNAALFPDTETVPWCPTGRYLPVRPTFTLDPYFHAGCYYVQEASSMYVGCLVKDFLSQFPVRTALDLCAAPGGKSTHLRSLLPDDCLLVSNEVVASRNLVLCQNLAKWGHPGTVVTRNEPEEIAASGVRFDLILVDAPCSGEGMFRKDPGAVAEWSLSSVTACAARQDHIVDAAVQALAPGGMLVYSTCTWSEEEDRRIAQRIRNLHGLEPVVLPHFPGIDLDGNVATFYPHLVKGEGFFVAAFRKTEATAGSAPTGNLKRKRNTVVKDRSLEDFKQAYFTDRSLACFRTAEQGWILPEIHVESWELLCSALRVFSSGTHAAEQKGKEWVPAPESAFSILLKDAVQRIEVDAEQALRYLRGESLSVSRSSSGWQLVTFAGHGLGWAKAVQGRLNNAYPKEWRIRMNIEK